MLPLHVSRPPAMADEKIIYTPPSSDAIGRNQALREINERVKELRQVGDNALADELEHLSGIFRSAESPLFIQAVDDFEGASRHARNVGGFTGLIEYLNITPQPHELTTCRTL